MSAVDPVRSQAPALGKLASGDELIIGATGLGDEYVNKVVQMMGKCHVVVVTGTTAAKNAWFEEHLLASRWRMLDDEYDCLILWDTRTCTLVESGWFYIYPDSPNRKKEMVQMRDRSVRGRRRASSPSNSCDEYKPWYR